MKATHIVFATLTLMFTGLAHSHALVKKSEPANNSTITQVPGNITLEFNEPVQLSVLSLQKGDGPAQDLKPLPSKATAVVTIPMPKVEAGSYIIKWRAAGDDGHIMSGKVLFTVSSPVK